MAERSVLHVLPHGGAGGEEYIDLLAGMDGFRFERMALSESRRPLSALARVPAVVRAARGHDLLHVHGDAAAILCRPALGRPSAITLHGLHLLARSRGPSRALLAAALRSAAARARVTICVSGSELQQARWALGDLPGLLMIRNGVVIPEPVRDRERAAARERYGLRRGDLAVAFAGALDERKDPGTLARAVGSARAEGAAVTALLAGEGPQRQALERAGPWVRVLGPLDELRPLFAAADAFCMPSSREGLSLALLEAMAAGLAPVVSDGPGNPEAAGETGIVFPFGDSAALASALAGLAGDPGRAHALGAAARGRAAAEFSAERMVRQTREAYLSALA